jgi:hypothetical protein
LLQIHVECDKLEGAFISAHDIGELPEVISSFDITFARMFVLAQPEEGTAETKQRFRTVLLKLSFAGKLEAVLDDLRAGFGPMLIPAESDERFKPFLNIGHRSHDINISGYLQENVLYIHFFGSENRKIVLEVEITRR